jgi:thiamine biosynthesis lipoprotein
MALVTSGCRTTPAPPLSRFEFQQPHMGTLFSITLYAPDKAAARTASDAAFARIAALNNAMTDYDPESELMRLCRQPVGQPVAVSSELFDVLQKSQRLAKLSDGAFDVTIGPVVRQWRRARRQGELPSREQLARAREAVGWQKLKLDAQYKTATLLASNMQLDLGGIAKGYAADQALETLRRHGVTRALVAASGDIAVSDAPPGKPGWRVSIGSPVASAKTNAPFARTLLLKHSAVSTAGAAEQFVEIGGVRYSHIVDPHTGVGLTNQLQVTVVAGNATDTDVFDTTVCVLGVQRGLKLLESQPGVAGLILQPEAGRLKLIESKRMLHVPRAD